MPKPNVSQRDSRGPWHANISGKRVNLPEADWARPPVRQMTAALGGS
ncbi:MAG TPA: hypothetical protein VG013_30845 [Gemmataceae bacterium]|nr:hypothetical protein [Gemmataceae bacterium]